MALPDEELHQLLLKYITGETTPKEDTYVDECLNDPNVFKEFEELWDLWFAVGNATNIFHFNVDDGWNETLKKIRKSRLKQKKKHSVNKIIWISSSIAATLLFFILFSFWQKNEKIQSREEVLNSQGITLEKQKEETKKYAKEETNIRTLKGQRRKVILPDGSKVWLNGNTSIHYFTDKDRTTRILYLEGQAFFDITHRANSPFIVKTAHAAIKVLGTRFSVSAYDQDSTVEATLTEGRILFKAYDSRQTIKEQLQPGQQIAVNLISNEWKKTIVDTVFYTSWKEGKIIFNNHPFQKIATEMEHKYNVHILFQSEELKHKKLNGYLEKESLHEALEALKLTLQFHYKIQQDTILISK